LCFSVHTQTICSWRPQVYDIPADRTLSLCCSGYLTSSTRVVNYRGEFQLIESSKYTVEAVVTTDYSSCPSIGEISQGKDEYDGGSPVPYNKLVINERNWDRWAPRLKFTCHVQPCRLLVSSLSLTRVAFDALDNETVTGVSSFSIG